METSEQNIKSPAEQGIEAQDDNNNNNSKNGGWITFPFIMGNLGGLSVAAGGWGANWIVFLITKFNIGSISATKINNVGFAFICLFPIVGAIIADSFAGNFIVIAISSMIALLGMTLLTLIVGIPSLMPIPCLNGSSSIIPCDSPSNGQYLILYTAMGLITMGIGGSRFTIATMGADQFEKNNHQASFFSWYFIVLYVGNAISYIVLVYLMDNISWELGFGICLAMTALGLISFLLGKNFYRFVKPKGSPFVSMARVVVAAIRNRKLSLTDRALTNTSGIIVQTKSPSKRFRLLNKACMVTQNEEQINSGSTKSWKLCTVEEVEDLKRVIKLIPLWSTGILLTTTIALFNGLSTIQALAMDREVGSIKIPAGTFLAFTLVTTAISIFIVDRYLLDMWQKLSGEAFHFPGQVALYYQEFPDSLKTTSTAMVSLLIGLGYYLSVVFTDFIDNTTGWLPNNINIGRVDCVYWLFVVIGVLNFGYYLVCAKLYEYQL
ncbi:hypothetical protein F8388_026891 [Cannabis sativa]|uniref:Uncharacterized protein n=1 Tax=Cannabis sativa TaxID=3483 RepID=A0A7J6H1Q7_CANSA|nr:hypothetical protein F8388_026891 [Cannabis sativa]